MSQPRKKKRPDSPLTVWARNARAIKMLGQLAFAMHKFDPDARTSYDTVLRANFGRYPNRPAVIGEDSRLSWRELDRFANRVANWAKSEGLERGDVVALSMENRPEFIAIWLGLSRVGVVSALMNTNLTGERLAHCVREANPRHWIVGSELAEACASALGELDSAPEVFLSRDPKPGKKSTSKAAQTSAIASAADFDALLAAQPDKRIVASPASAKKKVARAGDGLFLIYTSGTTGLPKAAKVSHRKAIVTGMGSMITQGLTPRDRTYCCLPLYHSAGGMMAVGASLFSGGALVVARKFSAKRFWSDCAQHDVTSIQYIGELCRYLLNSPPHPDERRHKVRVAIGNGLRPEIWLSFQERFEIDKIIEFYGATEGNLALLNAEGRVGAVGFLPHFIRKAIGASIVRFDIEAEEIVRDEDGFCEEVGFEEAGELVVKLSETAQFEGYTNPEATDKKILRDVFTKGDSYFRTGDLLSVDADGFFYFVDRIGDTYRWKGENVATSEVAETIAVHPGVKEANIYGVTVEGMDGRAGMAAIVAGREFDLEGLGRRVERDLPAYARPVFLRMLPEMEITGTFKHRKVDLVREGFDPRTIEDPLFYYDAEKGSYNPLDAGAYERIASGQIRI